MFEYSILLKYNPPFFLKKEAGIFPASNHVSCHIYETPVSFETIEIPTPAPCSNYRLA
jgi:hypothetical protein